MNNGIVLTVNLVGKLGATIAKEQDIQVRHGELLMTKHIIYLGKEESKCVRKTNISGEVVDGWIGSKSPFFIKEFIWKNMSKPQRLKAWVERFDEGFGVNYQEL
jgi:hypothetical protein